MATVTASLVILFLPGDDVPTAPPGTDKIVHAGLFAALTITGSLAGIRGRWLWPVLVAYAASSELIQPVLERSGDWADFLTDGGGIVLGALLWLGSSYLWPARPSAGERAHGPR